ncbi:ATP-dependent helicase [Marinobacter alkaliphilus]|uniref:DNA 3'-5' helicase n=1 Tax=Marinobacter alkaliphilus TaxID=254719 RepID=A0ABZ3E959_9GAMM
MGLSDKQQKAALAQGHARVIAGPGSGKTTLLVARTEYLLRDPQARVGLVTFASAAAGEMRERLAKKVDLDRVMVSTFDAFARRQVLDLIDGRRPPKPFEQQIAVSRAIKESELDYESDIAEEVIARLSARMYPDDGDPKEYQLFSAYQELLERDGLIEFSEIARMAVEGMRDGRVEPVPATHLLVDEFQDTAPVQLAWLEEHWKRGVLVTVVGDDDQSIYGFRHALGYKGMERFAVETKADDYFLNDCYRCSPEVVKAAQNLIGNNRARIEKAIVSKADTVGRVTIKRFENFKKDEIQSLDRFLLVHERECSPGRPAVLGRTNRSLDELEGLLQGLNWKTNRIGGKSIWEQRGAGLVLGLAELANSRERGKIGNGCTALMWAGCNAGDVDAYRQHVMQKGLYEPAPDTLSHDHRFQEFVDQLSFWSRLAMDGDGLTAMDMIFAWVKTYARGEQDKRIAAIASKILKPDPDNPKDSLGRRLASATRKKSATDNEDDIDLEGGERKVVVDIATLHGAKGMEWDSVWIHKADELEMPSKQAVQLEVVGQLDGIEEERRLFYVGMTRAKRRLGISCSSGEMSRFVVESAVPISDGLEAAYNGAEFSLENNV